MPSAARRRTVSVLVGCVLAVLLALPARAQPTPQLIGNLRVQVYSPNLVRVEERGPQGFEDRATFRITNRQWPGAPVERHDDAGAVTLTLRDAAGNELWSLHAPSAPTDAKSVTIRDAAGQVLWSFDPARATASNWLPGPRDFLPDAPARATSWSFADAPRLVPPPWGALPPPAGAPPEHQATSGWDTGNNATDLYIFLPGPGGYRQLRQDLLRLLGPTPLPPDYILGFIDSRYFVYTQQSALQRIDDYRSRGFPLDMLVIDTDWRIGASHGYDVDRALFPDMEGFLREAHMRNVRIMFNDHPEPKFETALDPRELAHRRDNLQHWLRAGVDVWWYDRNWNIGLVEPGRGLRKEVWGMRLYRDITLDARRSLNPATPDRPVIMANVDGIDNGRRTRPPDVAARLFPIQWTGDTSATWAFLRAGVDNALYEGLHALNPYISEDLGGHVGRPDEELYTRFVQFGALSPVMRLHCTKGQDRTPWSYPPEVERIAREYANLRERLNPVLYSAARRNYDTGEPLLRRLDLEFPQEPQSARADQYLLGDDLLVAPIVKGSSEGAPIPAAWLSHDGAPGLAAEYFANDTLQGPPTLTREDPDLNFDWRLGSPAAAIPRDHFSARWTGTITVPGDAAPFRPAISADDGVRLWIDGERVIDAWKPQAETLFSADRTLRPGEHHQLRVEYFELEHDAACKLLATPDNPSNSATREVWIPPGTWIDAWTGARRRGPALITAPARLGQVPLYIREGSVIPLAPDTPFLNAKPWEHLTLEVAAPASAAAPVERTLYEDDGRTTAYLSGQSRTTPLRLDSDPDQRRVRITIDPVRGQPEAGPPTRSWTLGIRPPTWAGTLPIASISIDGVTVSPERARRLPWPASPLGLDRSLSAGGLTPSHDVPRFEIDLPAADVRTQRTLELRWPPPDPR